MKLEYQKSQHRHIWCGPAAIALLAGVSYERAYAEAQAARRSTAPIRGMYKHEILNVLERLGHTPVVSEDFCYGASNYGCSSGRWVEPRHRPTLARWIRERSEEAKKQLLLVFVNGHFLVVKGRKFWDNNFPDGEFTSKAILRRGRMVCVIRLA